MISVQKILLARDRIKEHTLLTPLILSHFLSGIVKGKVYLKLESEQYTGSFKARGALNKLKSLTSIQRSRGAVTASTGNHAQGFARACEITGTKGTIYMPENASSAKIEALNAYSCELVIHGNTSLETEVFAHKSAEENNKTWVSPYNDEEIIAGQGTIAAELEQQLKFFDDVLVTIGGGGLISGIGSYLKTTKPGVRIIGCQPENSPEMSLSLQKGHIVDLEKSRPTLSDGSAGGIEPNAITFPICQSVVDDTILVSEAEIASAIRLVADHHHKIIEGAAGVAVASLLKRPSIFHGRTIVIIICGANISMETFKRLL